MRFRDLNVSWKIQPFHDVSVIIISDLVHKWSIANIFFSLQSSAGVEFACRPRLAVSKVCLRYPLDTVPVLYIPTLFVILSFYLFMYFYFYFTKTYSAESIFVVTVHIIPNLSTPSWTINKGPFPLPPLLLPPAKRSWREEKTGGGEGCFFSQIYACKSIVLYTAFSG